MADKLKHHDKTILPGSKASLVKSGGLAPMKRSASNALVPKVKAPLPVGSSYDPLKIYLSEIKKFALLTPAEEEKLLADYASTANPEAAQKLVTANLRLVVKIAMKFQSHWLNNILDLIQEGNMGLIQSVKKFDPAKGVKFSYYASYWIKAYILKYIMDNWRLVKVGTTQAQRKLFYNLNKERDKLIREGFEPGYGLLAERLGVNESEVAEMDFRLSAGREMSLDAPVNSDSEQSYVNLLPSNEQSAENFLLMSQLEAMFKDKLKLFKQTLSDRDKVVLEKRLLTDDPITLQEIGEEFGVSRERVRQLEERLKSNLASFLKKEIPDLEIN